MKIAIIGSGPSGFQMSKQLCKQFPQSAVCMFERDVFPQGLVRQGVAPDHFATKGCSQDFQSLMSSSNNLRWFGNFDVDQDMQHYIRAKFDQVFLAHGMNGFSQLGLPGEDATNVVDVKSFVEGQNGKFASMRDQSLGRVKDVVIIGHGNAGLDACRVLARPAQTCTQFPFSAQFMAQLQHSAVERVHVVGRRGIAQVQFTTAEFREITQKINGIDAFINRGEQEAGLNSMSKEMLWKSMNPNEARVRDRIASIFSMLPDYNQYLTDPQQFDSIITNAMLKQNKIEKFDATYALNHDKKLNQSMEQNRKVIFRFMLSPSQFISDADGNVKAVKFNRTYFEKTSPNTQKLVISDKTEEIKADLVIKATGQKYENICDSIPVKDGHVENVHGRVDEKTQCVGWVQSGPKGVIAATLSSTQLAFEKFSKDIESKSDDQVLKEENFDFVDEILQQQQNSSGKKVFSSNDYQNIEKQELEKGKMLNKKRQIIDSIQEWEELSKRKL